MQRLAFDWTVLGWSLAGAFIFGLFYSLLVHWVSKKDWKGQTAWSVVIGVTFTLLAMIPVFGVDRVAIIFLFFGFSGTPMIVEYLLRVQQEIQRDQKRAQELTKEILNDSQGRSR